MATKTFKIGLSNADKAAMAQDVYERVLALTFAEYDSAETYNEGDFVVYNDALYKCLADEVTGAWDSTKWQAATLQDLLDDVEGAVASVNDKASVNGNYPTMTVGFADNLTPYDESAGDDQDEPFSFQATGTGNGTQPDFSTGSGALMKEKQGNTVVVNQLYTFRGSSVQSGITYTNNNDGTITLNGTNSTESNIDVSIQYSNIPYKNGHKYLWGVSYISDDYYFIGSINGTYYTTSSREVSVITATQDGNVGLTFRLLPGKSVNKTFRPLFIDLTQWFNGDIPQDILDNPSNFFRYYQGSLAYNAGELVNADGRYIKCIGMNQWDEVAELGNIDGETGADVANNSCRRSKNYIKVIPNTAYHFHWESFIQDSSIAVMFYDINKNFLNAIYFYNKNYDFVVPANASFIRFRIYNSTWSESTVVANDISINLYYEDEPRCLTYEPYQVLTNNDTGTEVLRSAGSVKDSKAPDGTITRRIGYVDLGSLDWTYNSNKGYFYTLLNNQKNVSAWTLPNALISKKYTFTSFGTMYNEIVDITIALTNGEGGKNVYIRDSSFSGNTTTFKTAMSGVYLFYELDEPTTEQGTPYSENLVIDDFGSMDFGSDIPQGALIFYPVDYKAFIDTLYNYTDGTPSNIALKSDVTNEQTQRQSVDTQLKNALGGTLRQCLCVKESLDFEDTDFVDLGTLTWVVTGGALAVHFTEGNSNKILSTMYKTGSTSEAQDKSVVIKDITYNYYNLIVYDSAYNDATAFKNAMKGVLLAYEKASE